jgi:hypothetical protein
MPQVTRSTYRAAALVAAALLVGCNYQSQNAPLAAGQSTSANDVAVKTAMTSSQNLYVLNSVEAEPALAVYGPGQSSPLWSINLRRGGFTQFAFNKVGHLYIGVFEDARIKIYGTGGIPLGNLRDGVNDPAALTFDTSDRLYVTNHDDATVWTGPDFMDTRLVYGAVLQNVPG